MAGIYIHIPFCKTRCIYCGFYSTTRHELQDQYIDVILDELDRRKDYLNEPVETIYIGGGTPSQLSLANIEKLINGVLHSSSFTLNLSEFTIECNPDDVTTELATLLYNIGVNRVSMGVQSFSDERLRFLHRRHSADQARNAVNILRNTGITNISIDLMFGFPDETLEEWEYDIKEALKLEVPHISAYSLMYEEGTPLYRLLEEGKINEIDEEMSRTMYYRLIDLMEEAGYEHYEISNFARQGFRSRHNSSYWHEVPYLGLGAGAHSYNLTSRSYNTSEIPNWHQEVEELDEVTMYNDLITTALRTREGIESNQAFPGGRMSKTPQYLWDYMMGQAKPLIERGLLAIDNNHLHLTREGLYVSDDVMSELIYID